jgi:hypothetical protein
LKTKAKHEHPERNALSGLRLYWAATPLQQQQQQQKLFYCQFQLLNLNLKASRR